MVAFNPTSAQGRTGAVQTFVAPNTQPYLIRAWGAEGGSSSGVDGGRGAYVEGLFNLTQGDVLLIIVGQMPVGAAGGGGGSFVALEDSMNPGVADATVLLVAGGGGGTSRLGFLPGANATVPTPPATAVDGAPGGGPANHLGGSAGGGGNSDSGSSGGGGGGFDFDGQDGNGVTDSGGQAFVNGGAGGLSTFGGAGLDGGFGGGGGGFSYSSTGSGNDSDEAGGGGGYNGGGGGSWNINYFGGGGGSYNGGISPTNTAGVRQGAGLVEIESAIIAFPPVNVDATYDPNTNSVTVSWEEGLNNDWEDDDEVVVQIERTTCDGTETIATLYDPVNGMLTGSYVDRFLPNWEPGACGIDDHECEVSYCVSYHGVLLGESGENTDPIPEGVIFMWPDTAASIPNGWDRVTALDGRYPFGESGTGAAGATAGAATHSHTTAAHTHSMAAHTHPGGGTSSPPTTTITRQASSTTSNMASFLHTHTRPTTQSAQGGTSGTATPGTSSASNERTRKEYIFVESDGNPAGVPIGMAALMNMQTPPTGWAREDTDETDDNTAYLRGAATGQDGSRNKISVGSHNHSINAHTHTGILHYHQSPASGPSGTAVLTILFAGGSLSRPAATPHTHDITLGGASTGTFNSASGGNTNNTDLSFTLAYKRLNFIENISAADSQALGLIGLWMGTVASIPTGWARCDGTNGTPDLVNWYPRYALGAVGGSGGTLAANHTHSVTATHAHPSSNHSHSSYLEPNAPINDVISGPHTYTARNHSHGAAGTTGNAAPGSNHSQAGEAQSAASRPPSTSVHFIQLQSQSVTPFQETVYASSECEESPPIVIPSNSGNTILRHPVLDIELVTCPDVSFSRERPFGAYQGVHGGTEIVVAGSPGGRNYNLSVPVRNENDLQILEAILDAPLFHYAPSDGPTAWLAPNQQSVQVTKIKGIRILSVDTYEVDPEPVTPPEAYI